MGGDEGGAAFKKILFERLFGHAFYFSRDPLEFF
ncbi:hypothetical protein BSG1_19235 [Bacillus sp. SG-1]|nr:hypothetical protein BSG1_19235 [Bacillus sp. SG-1]